MSFLCSFVTLIDNFSSVVPQHGVERGDRLKAYMRFSTGTKQLCFAEFAEPPQTKTNGGVGNTFTYSTAAYVRANARYCAIRASVFNRLIAVNKTLYMIHEHADTIHQHADMIHTQADIGLQIRLKLKISITLRRNQKKGQQRGIYYRHAIQSSPVKGRVS